MGRPTTLTRSMLEEYGITDITTDGRVFVNDKEICIVVNKKETRYKTMQYHMFGVYDKEMYRKTNGKRFTRMIVLPRAMYAWYHGIAPEDYDVDHINNDSLDDRIENLQLLTRKENLAKRRGHMNQFEKSLKG